MIATIRSLLAIGRSDLQIQEEMDITETEYETLRKEMYRQDGAERFGKNTEEVYLDFCLRQEGVIRDLDNLIRREEKRGGRNANAVIGAARAKSEIIDLMVKRGQEFGLLQKVPEKHQIIAGVAIAELTDADLRGEVATQLSKLQTVMERYGERDIIDANPLPLLPPVVREKPTDKDGNVIDGTPKFAKGGRSKVAGSVEKRKRRIKRKKQSAKPPERSG